MSRLIRTRRVSVLVLAAVTVLGLAACGAEPDVDEAAVVRGPSKASAGSPGGSPFWVDPESPAARQVAEWQRTGRPSDAELLRRISEQPMAIWPAGEDPAAMMRAATEGAAKDGRTALFVAYDIPHRDCGQHSAGGATSPEAYREWIDRFAVGLGDTKAVVVLEPDAVAHTVDGCTPEEYRAERFQLLSDAIDRLKRQPHTTVYLDAGNPAWITDASKLREPLTRSGIERADGFVLNTSNFQTDADVRSYGQELSRILGGKHFVIDSSRNGKGPLTGDRVDAWCNPPDRALGTRPTTQTGDPLLDAFLWIKRPGESDGECRGGPAAGKWWPDYALGLARNSPA
ncbi:glycoside hydrolase family 6 protein [Streptomyces sp. NPDC091292]|uniref:glycoside hydrolase family 6 protein n=1 Tax=Streptomyces sp. NPDC091292 TaxID=3365991 RepID=UPI0037FE7894